MDNQTIFANVLNLFCELERTLSFAQFWLLFLRTQDTYGVQWSQRKETTKTPRCTAGLDDMCFGVCFTTRGPQDNELLLD